MTHRTRTLVRHALLGLVAVLVMRPGPGRSARAAGAEPTDLTLLAFNIHLGGVGPGDRDHVKHFFRHLLDLIGLDRSRAERFESLDRTAQMIDQLDPDVVVINEFSPWGVLAPFTRGEAQSDPRKNAIRYLVDRLDERLGERGTAQDYWEAHFAPYSENWAGRFGNLLLTRVGRVVTGTAEARDLYFETRGRLPLSERIFFRPLDRHHILARIPVRGGEVLVSGTHLEDHQDRHNVVVRRKAVLELLGDLEEHRLARQDPPTFLLGDLNAIPPAYYEANVDPGVIRAFRHDAPGAAGAAPIQKNTLQLVEESYASTYVARHGGWDPGGWTSPVSGPRYPLDYIYFTPETARARVQVREAFVPRMLALLGTISDHLPVVARVRIHWR